MPKNKNIFFLNFEHVDEKQQKGDGSFELLITVRNWKPCSEKKKKGKDLGE